MHTAPKATPTPMPALAPALSPESELGVDDDVDVEEAPLANGRDGEVEEDGDDGSGDVIDDDVPSDPGEEVDVGVEEAKSTRLSGAGA
ncbi:hypothetical protein ACLMJK_001093 [Lecanora helva]